MGNPETADGHGKAALDAYTDQATATLREALPLPPLNAKYAATIADALSVQFPGNLDLPRIVLACAQHLAPLGASGAHGASMVCILGAAGLQLDATQAGGRAPVAADQRAAIIRDLDKHARDAASYVAFMSFKFRELMESEGPEMPAADVVTADSALMDAMRALPELRRIFAKWARLLAGPPPRLVIWATDEPERLGIAARTPSGDLDVGDAMRTGTGDNASWRIRLTDTDGSVRATIGGYYEIGVDGLLEAVNRHMDEHGPWWAPAGQSAEIDNVIGVTGR